MKRRTSRPARPALCIAEDFVISRINKVSKPEACQWYKKSMLGIDVPPPDILARYCFSLHFPVSITYLMPGIVIDVSAMLVASIHFRVLGGVELKALLFCELS